MRSARFLAILLLTGCSFFSKSKSTFYSLDRIPPAAPVATISGSPLGIDLELPPGFDRREVVVRKANQQLEIRASQQWSADLQPLVLHTLAFDLASRLPAGMIILPGEAKPAAMRSMDVMVEELSAGPERVVVLDARWILAGAAHHERITMDIASLDSAEIATGFSRAIAALADRIAAGL
jgi:uncharacterized lipoprotein YmbA